MLSFASAQLNEISVLPARKLSKYIVVVLFSIISNYRKRREEFSIEKLTTQGCQAGKVFFDIIIYAHMTYKLGQMKGIFQKIHAKFWLIIHVYA